MDITVLTTNKLKVAKIDSESYGTGTIALVHKLEQDNKKLKEARKVNDGKLDRLLEIYGKFQIFGDKGSTGLERETLKAELEQKTLYADNC